MSGRKEDMTPEIFARRLRKMIRGFEQIIIDVESWNENRPDEPPLDCEVERVMLTLAKQARDAIINHDPVKAAKIMGRMLEYGERVLANESEPANGR